MSVIGIVCEFNPFHNGHKYLIDSVKKDGDIVVCVMSGNFVQRGEPALFPKDVRVKSTLLNGADILLELPFVYATASAEIFARNAVKILGAFGCDKIAFGTENTSLESLNNAVDIILSNEFDNKIKKYLDEGISYPAARQKAFDEYDCDCDISTPNNILAIEYLCAIKKNDYKLTPVTVNRIGAGYNDDCAIDSFASASYIRNLIHKGEVFFEFIPDYAYDLYMEALFLKNYLNVNKFNISALALLRLCDFNSGSIANMAEGLENRISDAVKNSVSLDEIYDKTKTKRFTHSRIKRAVLSAIFGVTNDDINISVPYCRLLGFNLDASDALGKLVKKCKIPFVANYSDIASLNDKNALRVFELEDKSTNLYNLSLQKSKGCSTEMTYSIIKLK